MRNQSATIIAHFRKLAERVIFYGKATADRSNQVLIAVSLDPYGPQQTILQVPLGELGILEQEDYQAHELLTDARALWRGGSVQVTLTPEMPSVAVAAVGAGGGVRSEAVARTPDGPLSAPSRNEVTT